jgi:hypothetical protein
MVEQDQQNRITKPYAQRGQKQVQHSHSMITTYQKFPKGIMQQEASESKNSSQIESHLQN